MLTKLTKQIKNHFYKYGKNYWFCLSLPQLQFWNHVPKPRPTCIFADILSHPQGFKHFMHMIWFVRVGPALLDAAVVILAFTILFYIFLVNN